MATRKKTVRIDDGYQNIVANLGTARDKAASGTYTFDFQNNVQLLAAYQTSWLAAKVVDAPAEDATRNWRSWIADAQQIEAIEALEKKLKIKKRVKEAMIAARLWGEAFLYINSSDKGSEKPLRVGSEVRSLVVLTKNELTPDDIVLDINSEYFGRSEYYFLQTKGAERVRIHASRLAVFYGRTNPAGYGITGNTNRGLSVLATAMDAVEKLDSVMANVCSLVFEAKVDVFKFKDWANMLADSSNDALMTRRLHLQAAQKSINGAVVIDADDDYESKSASFGGLPEIITKFAENFCGSSGVPFTRVFGRAAAGLSGNGEGDERTYYDMIAHLQENDVSEALSLLDECIIMQALGARPKEVYYKWRPLRQLTESERADIFSKTATGLRAIAGSGAGAIVPLDALSNAAVNEFAEQGMLPGLQAAIDEYGTLAEQDNLDEGDLDEVSR